MKTVSIQEKNTWIELTKLEAQALEKMLSALAEMEHGTAQSAAAKRAIKKASECLLEYEEYRAQRAQRYSQ